jgi:hypothetical protein
MSEILALVGLGAGFSVAVLAAVAWTIFWKGWSLWIAARKGEFRWFVVMLIINTFGILEILYLFVFKKMKFNFKTKRFEERLAVKEVNNPQSEPLQNRD